MSERAARTHTNPSNRATARDAADRKVVFRGVLDNPFRIQWPAVPLDVQHSVLARIIDMLGSVSEYHRHRERQSRKRKRSQKGPNGRALKKPPTLHPAVRIGDIEPVLGMPESPSIPPQAATSDLDMPAAQPPMLQHLTIGINEVTKMLEKAVQSHRETVTAQAFTSEQTQHHTHVILVCRGDVDPPILIQHLPHLVAACNSRRTRESSGGIWLIPLFKGAESTLSEAMGLRRVSVMAIHDSAPHFSSLSSQLESIPLVNASWLSPPVEQPRVLVPTHIKQLRTTAPKDMKAAKAERARDRAAARERRKQQKKRLCKQPASAVEGRGEEYPLNFWY